MEVELSRRDHPRKRAIFEGDGGGGVGKEQSLDNEQFFEGGDVEVEMLRSYRSRQRARHVLSRVGVEVVLRSNHSMSNCRGWRWRWCSKEQLLDNEQFSRVDMLWSC